VQRRNAGLDQALALPPVAVARATARLGDFFLNFACAGGFGFVHELTA
jgi:hypothetical protein